MKKIVWIAEICHEVNRLYCKHGGDTSQRPWNCAPQWQRDSAVNGVLAIVEGRITKPRDSHENWLAEKKANGWKYGPIKNESTKEHPCMVEFEKLSEYQQTKDRIFFNIVKSLI